MHSCVDMPVKRDDQCVCPGCSSQAVCWPYEKNRNVRFCQKHANGILVATVKSIIDGTHPDLVKETVSA